MNFHSNVALQPGALITGLAAATAPGHAVEFTQFTDALEGISWKDNVRVFGMVNINLAAPGGVINGVTMVTGNRFVPLAQTVGAENGIYVWSGAATPATRSADASTASELLNAVVSADEGTINAGATFRQTAVNITLGTTAIVWTSFNTGAPAATETVSGIAEIATQAETDTGTDDLRIVTPLKLATFANRKLLFNATVGDGSATQYDFAHNFNTRNLQVTVYRNSGNFDNIGCDVSRPTVNIVRLNFSQPPTTAQFAITILG